MERVGAGRRGGAPAGAARPGRERGGPLSPWGYLLFTGWAALVAALVKGRWLVGLALVEVAFGLAWSRAGLRLLRRPRFWVFVLAAVALGPFLIGEPDVTLGPLRLSRAGWAAGLEMAGRAFTLTLAVGLGVASLSLSDLVAVFDRLGLRGLGFAVALAMNMLGTLREMATVTLQTIRLRGGMRRPWLALRLFLITAVANTLRYGDEVVNAAAVRAFDPHGGQSAALPLRRADLWLLALLVGCTGALLAAGMR
jgi:energy-coupling factor transporter transmembrane protein EcfT